MHCIWRQRFISLPIANHRTLLSVLAPVRPCLGRPSSQRLRCHARRPDGTEAGAAVKVVALPTKDAERLNETAVDPAAGSWKWEESDDSVLAYAVLFGVLAAGTIPSLQGNQLSDLPYFISLAVATIYIGAHRGLTTGQRQMLTFKEGALAPVLASVSLFACYLVVKYLPGLSLQTFLNVYFWFLGSVAALGATGPLLRKLASGQTTMSLPVPEGLMLDDSGAPVTRAELVPTDVIALLLSVGLATAEVASNHTNYSLNNLMACLIATDILQLVGLRSFRTAGLMLMGLLAYDVFWVFGSPSVVGDNVMLTVATSDIIVGPMRLLFPRAAGGVGEGSDFGFSLLGLGDIAIPGLLACLALRYDASRVVDMKGRAEVAGAAISAALAALDPAQTSSHQMADAAANAADAAYDKFADKELRQRDRTMAAMTTAAGGEAHAEAHGSGNGNGNGSHGAGSAAVASVQAGEKQERAAVSEGVLEQRPYFQAVATSYVVGLAIAFTANAITHLGQPALLYIVPATLASVVAVGISRDEIYRVWQYTDVATFGLPAELQKELRKGGHDKSKGEGNGSSPPHQ